MAARASAVQRIGTAGAAKNFSQLGGEQLAALWRSVHGCPPPERVEQVFAVLVPDTPLSEFPSFVSDDHSPYEFSLLLGEEPEVRVMAEATPAAGDLTLRATITAGLRMGQRLRSFGADLTRLDAIADLFLPEQLPEQPAARFALWFGACFTPTGDVSFKVYLNPCVGGVLQAPALVEEALTRLGFEHAFRSVVKAFSRRADLDELRFLSLDLHQGERARVKVYGFLHDADAHRLADACAGASSLDAPRLLDFCRLVAGGDGLLRAGKEPGVALAFCNGESKPRTATLHIPVRGFAGNDHEASQRLTQISERLSIEPAPAIRALDALAQRPLQDTSGAMSWIGMRVGQGSPKLNVYLAPQSVAVAPSHAGSVPRQNPDSLLQVVEYYERNSVTSHPLFTRMARAPLDLHVVYAIMANVQLAVANSFARRLASVVARIEEDNLRSILAKQLDDELGHGDPDRTHRLLFAKLVNGLDAWRSEDPELLHPGKTFDARLEQLYLHRSAYEGFGATLIMECAGKQFDIFLGNQLRKGGVQLPAPILEWLTLHETLEIEHVDESLELARLVPRGWKESLAARGAQELADAMHEYLNNLYQRCFA